MAEKVEGKYRMVLDPVTGKKAIKFVPENAEKINANIERPEPDLKPANHLHADKVEKEIINEAVKKQVDKAIEIVEEREQQRPAQVVKYEEAIDNAAARLAEIEKQQRLLEEQQRHILMEEQRKQQESLGEVKCKIYMSSGLVYDNIMIPAAEFEQFIEMLRVARINKDPFRILNLIIFNLDAIDYLEYE